MKVIRNKGEIKKITRHRYEDQLGESGDFTSHNKIKYLHQKYNITWEEYCTLILFDSFIKPKCPFCGSARKFNGLIIDGKYFTKTCASIECETSIRKFNGKISCNKRNSNLDNQISMSRNNFMKRSNSDISYSLYISNCFIKYDKITRKTYKLKVDRTKFKIGIKPTSNSTPLNRRGEVIFPHELVKGTPELISNLEKLIKLKFRKNLVLRTEYFSRDILKSMITFIKLNRSSETIETSLELVE